MTQRTGRLGNSSARAEWPEIALAAIAAPAATKLRRWIITPP
jgi:hypothetical protein